MKRLGRIIIHIVLLSLIVEGTVLATPSTTYWTVSTSDVQPFNVWHIGVDNYFRLSRSQEELANGQFDSFPTDVGLTVGVLPFEKLNLEVGIDGLFPGTRINPARMSCMKAILARVARTYGPRAAGYGSAATVTRRPRSPLRYE